ncbi:MAG: SDR family oxidoreductase [Myxococcota bacterium]
MSAYLVTGGAGFVGSALVHELVRRGEQVRVLDDFSTGRRANLADVALQIDLVEADVTDLAAVERAVRGVEIVLHQAALASVGRSVEDPLGTSRVNATGTLTVLEAARRAGVRRVVYAASSSSYGETVALPKVESMSPRPMSPYAAAKLAGELYASAYTHCYGLETVALRYFNVFGPRQDPASDYAAVIPRFVTAYLRGEPPTVFGDGRQSRDFCYIDNVVAANLLACAAPGASGSVFNVACGDAIDLLGVLDRLAEIFGRRIEPRMEPARPGDVRHSRASIDRAREVLGYEPRVRFEEGLRKTVEWYRARAASAHPTECARA